MLKRETRDAVEAIAQARLRLLETTLTREPAVAEAEDTLLRAATVLALDALTQQLAQLNQVLPRIQARM